MKNTKSDLFSLTEKYIVITTVMSPTEAVKEYSNYNDYKLIVVGDKKTPAIWNVNNCKFISITEQDIDKSDFNAKIPYNHYSRKMIGYLFAINESAEIIIDTDDDNLPKSGWGFPNFDCDYDVINEDTGFINIYKLFTEQNIWPRGFPLNKINVEKDNSSNSRYKLENKKVTVGVWQGLVDKDPDVDAIYRLTNNNPCYFRQRNPVVLGKGTVCPFNSQNTAFRKELFPLLYLPAFVNFRFTDILRGLVAQPIMWLYGYKLGFFSPTVVQERNTHDQLKDFESEIPVYLFSEKILELVSGKIRAQLSINENIAIAYEELYQNSIVKKEELELLIKWLKVF